MTPGRFAETTPPIDIVSIQIRPDLTVRIAGIPHDLTVGEAQRISRVVLAMAVPANHPGVEP